MVSTAVIIEASTAKDLVGQWHLDDSNSISICRGFVVQLAVDCSKSTTKPQRNKSTAAYM